ncbi:transposase [Marivirga lumbricoides]|uniref:Transposase n=1 Tax=Marivirga lumbricoides TaxID=1046115 RepID=A0ABQ1N450_9BACT|nr:transposase [Marivirga lumbricoides]
MNVSISFECKSGYISRNGTIPLTLRITINRKNNYLNLGRKINVDQYDPRLKRIKPGIKGHTQIVTFIKRQEVKVDEIIHELERTGQTITFKRIKDEYNGVTGKVKSNDFYEYVEAELIKEKEETLIKESTLKGYEKQLNILKGFQKRLSIHEIDEDYLGKLKKYLIPKYASNTQYHVFSFLRKYTLRLHKSGEIKNYPFTNFIVGQPELVDINYLEPEEITLLHDLYDSKELLKYVKKATSKHAQDFHVGARYQSTLQHALVACYCGLRHSDIKTLRREHIQKNYIVKQMEKDRLGKKKTVRIPIKSRLLSLLKLESKSGLLFEQPVQENGTTNNYLKEIFKIAGINKHITFHGFRHAFAINSLLLGLKIEVVSDILGHSELTTTQRYARVVDRLREKEMDKWDGFNLDVSKETNNKIIAMLPKLSAAESERVLDFIGEITNSSNK